MTMLETTKKKSAGTAKKAAAPKKSGGAARTDGIHKPVTPSEDLAAIVGKGPMPRSEIVSKIWEHIKGNNLQDPKDKRQINADDKLEKIFGKKKASMFEMNKHLSGHVK
jgi:upstream activation factor subunit UAF30